MTAIIIHAVCCFAIKTATCHVTRTKRRGSNMHIIQAPEVSNMQLKIVHDLIIFLSCTSVT
jgi:hypothetical protein